MPFNPAGNEVVTLAGREYRVRALAAEGPLASKAMRVVGGRAQVYQLRENLTGRLYALKVMLPAFRVPQLVRNRDLLSRLAPLPGFEACKQTYFTPELHARDVESQPDLLYASLMPWIPGMTWASVISTAAVPLDPATSWEFAYQLVRLVRVLERNDIAHCDLSGGNVMVDLTTKRVSLIDFDEMYWPGAPPPGVDPTGTPGYRRSVQSQWKPEGDRFAMAILVAEMLGWRDERVRARSSGDTYFTDADHLNQDPTRYRLMLDFLRDLDAELCKLFARAWEARSLRDCPSVDEWRTSLILARGWRTFPLDPLDRARIEPLAPEPVQRAHYAPQRVAGDGVTRSDGPSPSDSVITDTQLKPRIRAKRTLGLSFAGGLLLSLALLSASFLLISLIYLGITLLARR